MNKSDTTLIAEKYASLYESLDDNVLAGLDEFDRVKLVHEKTVEMFNRFIENFADYSDALDELVNGVGINNFVDYYLPYYLKDVTEEDLNLSKKIVKKFIQKIYDTNFTGDALELDL